MLKLTFLKSQNFDEIVVFSAGSEKSSVLWRTRFFGFRRKSKISQNYDFLLHEGFCGGEFNGTTQHLHRGLQLFDGRIRRRDTNVGVVEVDTARIG